ncbi:MAG: type II toxin-antitoxin system VapC family toxin [Gammaproteobacteria bacterium]
MSHYKYLFDTNILSALIKNPSGQLAGRIKQLDETTFCTSIIVACELRYGALKKGSKALISKVKLLLANIIVLPLSDDVDRHYAIVRADLEKRGKPIGANDILISAHALALGVVLVTANEGEFRRIPGLEVENWLL